MIENADFHPVQDFRNILAETAQKIEKAEESALATASQMYETIVKPGSSMDKQLSAVGQKAHEQLAEAWNSVKGMKERFETAQFLSAQRTALVEQMRGNRAMLTRMREMSYAVPSKQMAALMRRITECNKALERTEVRAKEAFIHATGLLAESGKNLTIFQPRKEPQRYAKYSCDPLLGISTFPLGFHLLVLGCTEIPLRVLLKNRGFERRYVGPVTYYYHPGSNNERDFRSFQEPRKTPIVFVHGIGVGNIFYMTLIDHFLKTGRPLLLPEIPYVSGFRPWQSSSAVLSPAVVASTVSDGKMLKNRAFVEDMMWSLPFSPPITVDDRHAGNSWICERNVCWPFLWNFVAELRLQICAHNCRGPFVLRSGLLLSTLSAFDEKLCLSSTRSWY